MKTLARLVGWGFLTLPLVAAPVTFVSGPSVAQDGARTVIRFAVSAPTDVEVAVLDASGRVVRHLAAGVLGGPRVTSSALFKPGLVQEIVWDGRDDLGKLASGFRVPGSGETGTPSPLKPEPRTLTPLSIRVRAGLQPQADGFLLENPASSGAISSLAVGPGGSLYVFHRDPVDAHWGSTKIKVLSRDAKHERAIMPFSAALAPERIKPLGAFRTETGEVIPRIHDLLRLNFYCKYSEPFWRTTAQCPVVDSRGRVHWLVIGPAVASLDADGGVPYETLTGPKLLPELAELNLANEYFLGNNRPCLALSSDEKFLYFAGLTAGSPKRKDAVKSLPCVFRVPLDTRGPAEVFLGKSDASGTEKELLTAPRGLAVANGLIYVADHAANRVVVFNEKDRSLAGEIKVKAPDSLGVDPVGGAVYVCSLADPFVPDLIKYENGRTGKELYRLPLPKYKYANERIVHRIAVDASARPVRIWVPTIPYTAHQLLCIEDADDRFVSKGDPRSTEPWAEGPRDITYDRVRGEIYVKSGLQKWYRLDEKTGKVTYEFRPAGITSRPEYGTQLVPGADGNLYTYSWSGQEAGLRLYSRDGKPANWPGLQKNHIPLPGVMNYMQRSLHVRRSDELLIIPPGNWRTDSGGGGVGDGTTCLNIFGMDGKARQTLIWQCLKGAILRTDLQGNIYLAEMIKPLDRVAPAFFDGKIAPPPSPTGNNDDRFYYSYMYGSIVQFPPTGGAIWYTTNRVNPYVEGEPPADLLAQPKVKVRYHLGYRSTDIAEMQGALWFRFGFAPYTATQSSCYRTCMCEGGGFDVDSYGRVFFPNLGQFRIEVLDTDGNPITTFGRYGNQDDFPNSALRLPHADIPLAWPINVAVSDTHAYVADTLNRRVAKVKFGYVATASCAVP